MRLMREMPERLLVKLISSSRRSGNGLATTILPGGPHRCCQTNSNQSLLFADEQVSGRDQLAPFEKSGVA